MLQCMGLQRVRHNLVLLTEQVIIVCHHHHHHLSIMVVECQPVQQPLYDIPSGSLCLLLLFSVRGEGPLVKGLWAYSIGDFVFKNTPHLNALWVPASSHRPLQKFSVFRIPDIFPYNLGVTADWIWQDSFRLNIQIKFYHKNSTYPNIGEQL